MSFLVLTHYRLDRPVGGAPLRNWQNIHALAQLGSVDVVAVGVDDVPSGVAGVRQCLAFGFARRSWRDRARTACWLLRPASYHAIERFHLDAVTQWVRERIAAGAYRAVVVEGISLACYVSRLRSPRCLVVFDAHNVESELHREVMAALPGRSRSVIRRAKDWVVERRIARAERRAVRDAQIVWACSDRDARALERLYDARTITIVPNAVDVETYALAPPAEDWSGQPITLLYAGLFAYRPNADAALRLVNEVLPAVRARGYDVRVLLVGRDPTAAMRAAAGHDPAVCVTGAVTTTLPYLDRPCIVTLPIALGSGTRLKILEAFAAGRAVVTTAKGAEGLDVVDGTHLMIRDDAAAMADAIVDLWTQPLLRARVCAEARRLAEERYSWPVAAARIAASLRGAGSTPMLRSGDEATA